MLHQSCPKGFLGQAGTAEVPEIPLEHHPHGHCPPPSLNKDDLFTQVLFPKHEQTLYNAEQCTCWLESTNSPRVNQQPLFISSYPCFSKRTTVCCTALLLSLHDFPRLVALTFVVWTLHTSEEHKANEKSVPSLATAFSGAASDPHTRAGL